MHEITKDEYDKQRKHGYAGPLSVLHGAHTRTRYEEQGADGWQLAGENGGAVLRPIKITD